MVYFHDTIRGIQINANKIESVQGEPKKVGGKKTF